jgi:hypothetical protein
MSGEGEAPREGEAGHPKMWTVFYPGCVPLVDAANARRR